MSAFGVVNLDFDIHRSVPKHKTGRNVLGENLNFQQHTMNNVKRKKTIFFPTSGVCSAQHVPTAIRKHVTEERRVLSDNSNISHSNNSSISHGISHSTATTKKQTVLCAEYTKVSKAKPAFRATPGNQGCRKVKKHKLSVKKKLCINGPERVIPFDEPMDLDDPALRLRHLLKTVPVGIKDIDADKGEFYTPDYAQDIIDYLQAVETRWSFPEDFLEDQAVTSSMRAVLVDWLMQVQCHERLNDDTLHLTVALIDRYICHKAPAIHEVQLLGITCVLIAAKFVERFPPEIATLCHLTDNTYTEDEVITMEIMILKTLKFDLNIPGPIVFLDRFLQAEESDSKVSHLCKYLLDLSLVSADTVRFVPSMVAAGALYLSRRIFRSLMGMVWTPNLSFYSKYSEHDLIPCVRHLEKLLNKAPTGNHKAAKNKHAKSDYGCISSNPLICQ
ncbi:uncharacterized protein [Haliotis cracherodii]|uniref:uncharacterized protein n=1 Tax=Haliotis cracherodii TaxID=6455 RepID=UPI0039EC8034